MASAPPPQDSKAAIAQLNSDIAKTYDAENRGIPRLVARHILTLIPPISSTSVIHDNACGPAVVTSELLGSLPTGTSPTISATDISGPMVDASRELIATHGRKNVTAEEMDAQKLSFKDDTFTHSITNLGLFMATDPVLAAKEVYRTLQPEGTAVVTTWKSHGFVNLLRRISLLVRPDEPLTGMLATKSLEEKAFRVPFEKAGFRRESVSAETHGELLRFQDLQDLRTLLMGPFGKFITKDWDREEVDAMPTVLEEALTDEEKSVKGLQMVVWVAVAKKSH